MPHYTRRGEEVSSLKAIYTTIATLRKNCFDFDGFAASMADYGYTIRVNEEGDYVEVIDEEGEVVETANPIRITYRGSFFYELLLSQMNSIFDLDGDWMSTDDVEVMPSNSPISHTRAIRSAAKAKAQRLAAPAPAEATTTTTKEHSSMDTMKMVEKTEGREIWSRSIEGCEVKISFAPALRASDFTPGNSDAYIRLFGFVAAHNGNAARFYYDYEEGCYKAEIFYMGDVPTKFIGVASWRVPTWNRGHWSFDPRYAAKDEATQDEEEATQDEEEATTIEEGAAPMNEGAGATTYHVYMSGCSKAVFSYKTARGLEHRLARFVDEGAVNSVIVIAIREAGAGEIISRHPIEFMRAEYGRGWQTDIYNPIPGCATARSTNAPRVNDGAKAKH